MILGMYFEFDPEKSWSNLRKHGIDFNQAQSLWDDPNLIEVPLITDDEPRFLVVARLGTKHWSAITTYREQRVRLISVRRARENEVKIYEST
jgi:uncharacterized protein